MHAGGKDHFHLVCLFQREECDSRALESELVSLCWPARCVNGLAPSSPPWFVAVGAFCHS